MLRYLNAGRRDFQAAPIEPHTRSNWEFYAVVKGGCGVRLETGESLPIRRSHLWIFPPGHLHGWHGEPAACDVAVFHFDSAPSNLPAAIGHAGFLERELGAGECERIAAMARALQRDFDDPDALSPLRFQRALLDLTLVALAGIPGRHLSPTDRLAQDKVEAALSWYRRHLREKPTMEKVARAIHVSPSHLRRLFVGARSQSPRETMIAVRVEMAVRLLRETDLKLEAVAAEAGFASGSDLSRVFKRHRGCSPRDWRSEIHPRGSERKAEAAGLGVAVLQQPVEIRARVLAAESDSAKTRNDPALPECGA